MKFLFLLGLMLAVYGLQSKYVMPRVTTWMNDRAPYWKRLCAVYITGACFILMFGVPAIILAAFNDGLVLSAGSPAIPLGLVAKRSLGITNAFGLMCVVVRLGHDGLLLLLTPRAQARADTKSSEVAPKRPIKAAAIDRQATIAEATELFHRLWGEAGTAKYNKTAWNRLQQLLNRLDVPV